MSALLKFPPSDRTQLITQIEAFEPFTERMISEKPEILRYLHETPNCFYRECLPAHMTACAVLFCPETRQFLLNYHILLDNWLQFGGHCDGDENVYNTAMRELEEETGLTEYKLAMDGQIFDMGIHLIPFNKRKKDPPHLHYDVTFLFTCAADQIGKERVEQTASSKLKWCDHDEALEKWSWCSLGDALKHHRDFFLS